MKSQQFKRVMDIIGSLMGLILVSPIILVISLMVYLTMGRPIFFKQIRTGLNGKPFIIYKFRTMRDLRDVNGELLSDKERLTKIGKIFRFFRLDELPELLNILKGDMSFVGPRPTLIKQTQLYSNFQKKRLRVRPGLTGWSQINGNTELSWDDRILLDIWYIDHWSLKLDLEVIIYTIKVVFKGEIPNFNALKEASKYASYTYRSC